MSIEHTINPEGVLIITLDRPEKLNALNDDVLKTLDELFNEAKHNPTIKSLLITGSGKAFCAGADIMRLKECNTQTGYEFAAQGQAVFRQLETLGKPSVAAINGYAFGGGCELAMATTLRIAATTAQLGQPEIKLGIIPGYGGTQRLSRLIGKARALDLCLTGRFINATTACDWGLVNEVVEPDDLMPRALDVLKTISAMPPLAIQSIMQVIDKGFDMSLPESLHLEAIHFAALCASDDKKEGVNAFLEKRAPAFTGV